MSERGNEFELWPSRFLGDGEDSLLSLVGWPPSAFQVAEARMEVHKRLGQIRVLDRVRNEDMRF